MEWGRGDDSRGVGLRAEGLERKYDFSQHDVYPGIVLGIGGVQSAAWAGSGEDGGGHAMPVPRPCVHVADGWLPMQAELDTRDSDDTGAAPVERLGPHMYGCVGSGLRVLSAAGWMLRAGEGDGGAEGEGRNASATQSACTYVWPLQRPAARSGERAGRAAADTHSHTFTAEDEDEREQMGARRLAGMLGVHLVPALDTYAVDTASHCTAALSGHVHSSVRLIPQQEMQRHQRLSSREFLYLCLTDHAEAVTALERARYVFLPGSTLGLGLLAPTPTSRGGDAGDATDAAAAAADSLLAGAAGALSVVFERCSMDNKAVFLSLVGAATSRLMRADLMVALQYTDFLFLTELECRRLLLILNFDPNRTLEESAVWLADYTKVSGVRPRIVVVIPNSPAVANYSREQQQQQQQAEETSASGSEAKADAKAEEQQASPNQPKNRSRFDSSGRQIYREFREYDRTHHLNADELGGRVLLALSGDFFYLPGWPTSTAASSSGSSVRGGGSVAMSTYFYNAKLDFRVDIGDVGDGEEYGPERLGSSAARTLPGSPSYSSAPRQGQGREHSSAAAAIDIAHEAEAHQAYADNFVGGFLAMVVRAEQQVDVQHEALARHAPSSSFVQGTLPNEKVLEMAKDRSVRLQRERERAWPGGLRPPPVQTPRTATPQLNPAAKRVGLTGTQKRTLFQTGESRGRNALGTAGAPAAQMSVNAWGDRENEENQHYEQSRIKWASSGPTTGGNLVAGRRLLHECVQAGLCAVYEGNYSAQDHRVNRCRFFDLF
jgi:hypothetical protein